jgi:Porin PorA
MRAQHAKPSNIAVAGARNGGQPFLGGSMRRVIGLALAGLGAFLIVGAVLTSTYVGSQVIKYPLNEYYKTTLQGTGISYFSPKLVRPVSGATIRATSTVKGDAAAGTSSTAVWDGFTYLYDVTNNAPYEYNARRFAFDRRTAELVSCCGASVGGNTAIRQSGLVGFLWPMGTHKQTYQVFDPVLNQPRPARYDGTATVDGIRVYRFVESVPSTKFGRQTLPGSLVGMKGQPLVTLPEYYAATNTFWVDPATGAQLDVHENQKLTLQDAAGTQRLLLFDGDLIMTPPSVRTTVHTDATARNEISLVQIIIPLVSGLVGIVVLVVGIVLARRRREDGQREDADAEAPEPARDPEPEPARDPEPAP